MDPAARVPIELLLEHRAWVQALARALVGDESRADDIAQDAWLAALRHPPRHAGALKAWLGRLVRHRAANARRGDTRRVARELAGPSASPSVDPADSVARIEAHERVVRAVLALTEPYRTTVVLRFYEDLSGPQIAARMDVPLETVRTRMKRAFAQLRERLDADHGGDGTSWSVALVPLAWGTGGVVMKTSTKAGLAAAALFLLASTAALTWPRGDAAPSAPPEVATVAELPKPIAIAPQAKPRDATAAAIVGEVWRRDPETPAAGVVVRLTANGTPDRTVTADARGRFRFDELPRGTRGAVRVATDSEAVAPAAVAPLLPGETCSVGILWLVPTGSLDVVVTALDGTPLEDAHVETRSRTVVYGVTFVDRADNDATWRDVADPVASATTDATGRATLRGLARGGWSVSAAKAGFVSGWGGGDVDAAAVRPPVQIVLLPGADLLGSVEDRAGRPVVGVVVRAHRARAGVGWGGDVTTPRATTAADGRFTLTGVPEGAVSLSVARRGEAPTVVGSYRVPTSSLVRVVVGGPTITGRVVDVATGAPIAGARVRAHAESWMEAVSDETGAYSIAFLAERVVVHQIRVEKAGYVLDGAPSSGPRGLYDLARDESARLELKLRLADGLRGPSSHGGAPVRGARVAGLRMGPIGLESVSTTTDGDGRYTLDGVAGTTLLVQVQAPRLVQPDFPMNVHGPLASGKRVPKWSVDVPADGGATLDVELVAGDDVAGRVLGPGDAPIEGALVGVVAVMTRTAGDGSFALHGVDLRGTFVSASKQGFAPAWEQPRDGLVTIRLAPLAVVSGTVRAEGGALEDGWVEWAAKPVVPATYSMGAIDRPPPPVEWSSERAPVAADGTFEVSVEAGAILLRAGGRRHGPSAPVEVTLKDSDRTAHATIDVAAVETIRGRVVSQDGVAVPGASVELDRAPNRGGRDDGRPAPGVSAAVSDVDGRFEIPSATPGAHRVFVDADGFLSTTVDFAAATDEIVVRLAPAAEVRGAVVWSDGRPVETAMITLFAKGSPSPFGAGSFRTPYFTGVARHGAFRVVVPPGTYTAYVSPSDNNVSIGRRTFEDVVAGGADVKFVIDVGPMIAGRVVGADDGAPLAGAGVDVFVEGGKHVAHVTADAQGRFQAEAPGAGQFAVVALSGSTDRSFTSGFIADKRYLRDIAHGVSSGAVDVELRLPVGAEIAGSLVDASGAPVVGRWVVAHRLAKYVDDHLHDDGWQDRGARTDAAGRFVLTGLVADSYRFFAAEESGPRRTPLGGGESVTTGARDVRVVLPGTASISGRVVDETGAPFAGVSVAAVPPDKATFNLATTKPDGTFEIVGVADFGTYTVAAQVNNRAPIRALDIAPGATGVQLKVTRGLRAGGRLVDAAGKPLARATLVFRTENDNKEAQTITDADGRFTVDNLLPGSYRMENFAFQAGKGVYLPVGTLTAGDENVELRRAE